MVDHSPVSGSQQTAAELTTKHNTGNQETPQQQTTPSLVKNSTPTKSSSTSSQSSTSEYRLEESLKEKAGLQPLQPSDQHSHATPSEAQSSISLHLEDSNKSVPSEKLSILAPEGDSIDHVTRESETQKPSDLSEQQTAADESQSGMMSY